MVSKNKNIKVGDYVTILPKKKDCHWYHEKPMKVLEIRHDRIHLVVDYNFRLDGTNLIWEGYVTKTNKIRKEKIKKILN